MASESSLVEVRFAHLLKPIRDLAENWDVDVASELEGTTPCTTLVRSHENANSLDISWNTCGQR